MFKPFKGVPEDGLPNPQRYLAIATVAAGVTMAVLDGAIVNIALPTIARDFNVTAADSVWVVNAYQFIVLVSLLAFSSLGEIYGYRYIYRFGLAVFGVASLACAMSDSLWTLVAARLLQGFGAAAIMSVNTALVRFIYPRAQLGRGIAINAQVVAVAAAAGPTLAAAILSFTSWHWLFLINIPFSVLALWLSRYLPMTTRGRHSFDFPSAALNAATFALLIVGIEQLGHGVGNLGVPLAAFAGAGLAGFLLVRRQLGRHAPLFPVDLLKLPIFSLSVGASVTSFIAQLMIFISLPFYFQNVLGFSELDTGLLMTPWPLALLLCAQVVGRLTDRVHPGYLGSAGLVVLLASVLSLGLMPAQPGYFDIIWRMFFAGLGFAFFQTPNNRTLINAAPTERTGGASGTLGMARLLGQTTGAAFAAVIFRLSGDGAAREALMVAAVCVALALILSLSRLSRRGGRGRDAGRSLEDF
ncbi:MFS transporter [Parvibaculum sp. MBR-TMA-1.3b-4.2]|jgi:DHA2 family multidrug resistance protein-like MFS transporter